MGVKPLKSPIRGEIFAVFLFCSPFTPSSGFGAWHMIWRIAARNCGAALWQARRVEVPQWVWGFIPLRE